MLNIHQWYIIFLPVLGSTSSPPVSVFGAWCYPGTVPGTVEHVPCTRL